MLTDPALERILDGIPGLTLGVLGDLFLDRYLDIDGALTEPSLETGLDAYQIVQVRSDPGAAGTVISNLAALGVGRICAFSVIGRDGEGFELLRALGRRGVVDRRAIRIESGWRTPTYTKPMLRVPGQPARELNRLDIKNRVPMSALTEAELLEALGEAWGELDGLLVLDQASRKEHGVITGNIVDRLAELGAEQPPKLILADSRERLGRFRDVWLKPNRSECLAATGGDDLPAAVRALAGRVGRPVFCTCGAQGIYLVDPRGGACRAETVPAYPVEGPIDIVGAGDSTSAAIACALATGADPADAAAFGNLVASITIQQIGCTGTASPEQVRKRWREIAR